MHGSKCNLKIDNKPLKYSPILGRKQEKTGIASTIIATSFVTGICFCSPQAISAINPDAIFFAPGSLFGERVQSGRTSWFGQLGYGKYKTGHNKHVWRDSGDNGVNASGLPQVIPGIALYNRKTLGHWYEVELRGKVYRVKQVDIGPAPWTGRKVDVNAALADLAGWTPGNFPTDSQIRYRYLGPNPPIPSHDIQDLESPKVARLEKLEVQPPKPKPPEKPRTFADLPARVKGKYPHGLHPVIRDSMLEASKLLPVGYKISFNNAAREYSSVGSSSYHLKRDRLGALAVDVEIIDNHGRTIPNIKSPRNFAMYREFMQNTKKFQYEMFPNYRGKGRWGGYFSSGVSQDLMHYDLGRENETAAGNWEGGLHRGYRYYGRPGDVGKGMGKIANYVLPPVPGFPIPDLPPLAIAERAITAPMESEPVRMALGYHIDDSYHHQHHRHHRHHRRFRR